MKKLMFKLTLMMFVLALFVSTSMASSLNEAIIPANTKWLVHFDVEQFNKTAFKESLLSKNGLDFLNQFSKEAKKEANFDPLTDMVGMTMFGTVKGGGEFVACIQGKFDQIYFINKIKKEKGFGEQAFGKCTIYNMKGNNYVAFARKDMLCYSQSETAMKTVLALMDGKGKSMGSSKLMDYVRMAPKRAFAMAVAIDIADLIPKKQAGMILGETGMATFMALENNKKLNVNMTLKTSSPESANKVVSIINGITALVSMKAQTSKVKDEQFFMELLKAVKITTDGSKVKMDFSYPSEKLVEMIKRNSNGSTDHHAHFFLKHKDKEKNAVHNH